MKGFAEHIKLALTVAFVLLLGILKEKMRRLILVKQQERYIIKLEGLILGQGLMLY